MLPTDTEDADEAVEDAERLELLLWRKLLLTTNSRDGGSEDAYPCSPAASTNDFILPLVFCFNFDFCNAEKEKSHKDNLEKRAKAEICFLPVVFPTPFLPIQVLCGLEQGLDGRGGADVGRLRHFGLNW